MPVSVVFVCHLTSPHLTSPHLSIRFIFFLEKVFSSRSFSSSFHPYTYDLLHS